MVRHPRTWVAVTPAGPRGRGRSLRCKHRTPGCPVAKRPIAVMSVEVTTPVRWLGDVMGDLSSRRGQIVGIDAREPGHVVHALVPLPGLLHYADDLRSITDGRASYQARFSHHRPADGDEPGDGAGVPAPLRPLGPTLAAGAEAEPPPDPSGAD